MRTTDIGYINPQLQKVIRRVGPSPSHKGQNTYELLCTRPDCEPHHKFCDYRYGANGADIKGAGGGTGRKCPICQDGAPGDPI